MTRRIITLIILGLVAGACSASRAAVEPTASPTEPLSQAPTPTPFEPVADPTATETATPAPTPTPTQPVTYGPDNFPPDVDPLTGIQLDDPALLERRPLAIKVSNFPRYTRPQWGLSLADIVYEYYQNGGISRFHAIFYSHDAERVGPIRSARHPDAELIRMYGSVFAFGSGDFRVLSLLNNSEFAPRMVNEYPAGCGPMCRVETNTYNHLVTNTDTLSEYIDGLGVSNTRQDLTGMYFHTTPPGGGQAVNSLYVRYGPQVYARWDYDPETNHFLRFSDTQDDLGAGEAYEELTDRLTEEPIAAANVVLLQLRHDYISQSPEIIDIQWRGTGTAYAFRDGQVFEGLSWTYAGPGKVISLVDPNGAPFPFKPGITWFEVVGQSSPVTQPETGVWRAQFRIP